MKIFRSASRAFRKRGAWRRYLRGSYKPRRISSRRSRVGVRRRSRR